MKRVLVILLACCLLLAVALKLALEAQPASRTARTTLTSGEQIELLAALPGGTSFSTETPWARRLKRYLPRFLLWRLPSTTTGSCGGGSNQLVLYLNVTTPAGTPPGNLPWTWYAAEDDTGFRYPMEGGSCSFGGPVRVYGFSLRAFPRRQNDFLVRFLDRNRREVGSMRVPNPLAGAFPNWQGEPLPVARTNDPVVLTLESFRIAPPTVPWQWGGFAPRWRLTSTNPAWAGAAVSYVTLLDATGNEGYLLSTNELVWCVRAVVHRKQPGDFAPHEKFSVTNLALPAPGTFMELNRSFRCLDVSFKLRVFCPPGELWITNGVLGTLIPSAKGGSGHSSSSFGATTVECWSSATPFLLLETVGELPSDELRLSARDALGREVKLEYDGWYGSLGGRTYLRRLKDTTNAGPFTLECILSRPLNFEFLVSPKDASPEIPPQR